MQSRLHEPVASRVGALQGEYVSICDESKSRLFYSHTGDKTDGYLPIYLFTYLQVFVPEDWGSYVSEMSRDAAWGDHITLQAASDAYGVGMCVISSYKVSLF